MPGSAVAPLLQDGGDGSAAAGVAVAVVGRWGLSHPIVCLEEWDDEAGSAEAAAASAAAGPRKGPLLLKGLRALGGLLGGGARRLLRVGRV